METRWGPIIKKEPSAIKSQFRHVSLDVVAFGVGHRHSPCITVCLYARTLLHVQATCHRIVYHCDAKLGRNSLGGNLVFNLAIHDLRACSDRIVMAVEWLLLHGMSDDLDIRISRFLGQATFYSPSGCLVISSHSAGRQADSLLCILVALWNDCVCRPDKPRI